ncbi:ATP-binding cassette domain-containing protein [Ramlibacter sp. AW1]|uniref:ATP-binding cassette domain-containing protein n=1 Tax=Ramlibacter aurantiacus TaxID=2801330 RepID=A0A936ZJD6_9BURK|nr:ATP-binding cassette domain-containing protein [Ramlibacter aurantiacus]MBL0421992.1 ATP-binding cassette domain-containing protein [Ramlibacter aurantiacus]
MSFLCLHAVDFGFADGTPLLHGLDLELARGEIHCIVGRSGCGKTTLLRLAAGLLQPQAGQVSVGGVAPEQARSDIGFVFQAPTLLEWLPVLDNVLLPVSLQRRPGARDVEQARQLLARLGLGDYAQRYPRQLSGGQQSRVALARALVLGPSLLLLDEPFAALDAITREELQADLLRMCRSEGTTVLFVTHDIAEAVFLGDRVTVMDAGRIVRQLPVAGLHDRASPAFAAAWAQLRQAMHLPVGEAMADAVAECAP